MDHGLIVDLWEVAINQIKLESPEEDRPDGFDLDVRE